MNLLNLVFDVIFISVTVGSAEERKAVEFAYKFSTRREYDIYNAEKEDVEFNLEVLDDVAMGDSFDVKVVARNKSNDQRTVKVNITSVMAFYTGIPAKPLKREIKTLSLAPRAGTVILLNHVLIGELFLNDERA